MQLGRGAPTDPGEPYPPRTTRGPSRSSPRRRRGRLAAYAGCPTWANKEWLGSVYPAAASDLLVACGQAFDRMGLNVTHYRIPDEATVRRWREALPADLRFAPRCPKPRRTRATSRPRRASPRPS